MRECAKVEREKKLRPRPLGPRPSTSKVKKKKGSPVSAASILFPDQPPLPPRRFS